MFSYIAEKGVLLLFSTIALALDVHILYFTHFKIILLGSMKNPVKALLVISLYLRIDFGDLISVPGTGCL